MKGLSVMDNLGLSKPRLLIHVPLELIDVKIYWVWRLLCPLHLVENPGIERVLLLIDFWLFFFWLQVADKSFE